MNVSNGVLVTDASFNPYSNPLAFCDVVDSAVQAHYQAQLNSQFMFYLLGGVVIGLLLAWCYYVWRVLPKQS